MGEKIRGGGEDWPVLGASSQWIKCAMGAVLGVARMANGASWIPQRLDLTREKPQQSDRAAEMWRMPASLFSRVMQCTFDGSDLHGARREARYTYIARRCSSSS